MRLVEQPDGSRSLLLLDEAGREERQGPEVGQQSGLFGMNPRRPGDLAEAVDVQGRRFHLRVTRSRAKGLPRD